MAADITDSRWTRLPDDGPHRVFTRALGSTEASFYWDGAFCGTADVVERHTVRVAPCLTCADPALDAARFRAVWMALKRRFPLLAARVEESDRGGTLRFVVSESRMDEKRDGTLDLDEFEFFADASAEDVEAVLQRGLNSPVRRLSQGRLGALSVLRRTDQPEGTYDVVSVIAHAITDGMSSFSFGRTMCDLLARWPSSLGDPIPRLEEALVMVPSSESLLSSRRQPLARRRWRMAAARIINAHRVEQLVGGQTIPRTFSELTSRTPAVSRKLHFALPSDVSSAAVAACRAYGVTIGHTLPVLGQVALSRMMHRRLARGELSLDEWEQRKLGPTMTGGPLNLRPILDPEWIKRGGFDATGVFIGFFFETLPCIPRAPLRDPADETSIDTDSSGAPPLRVLLPRGRFWLRAAMGKRTGDRYHRHPLFPEMVEDFAGGRIERVSGAVDIWRRVCRGEDVPVQPIPEIRGVMTHGGSSIGKIEHFLPREYPLRKSPSDPQREPTLLRLNSSTHLRCRPAELYLGTSMTGGALHYYIFYDANVYEDAVVEEWFGEIRGAIMHFLSGDEMEGRLVDEARSSTAKL